MTKKEIQSHIEYYDDLTPPLFSYDVFGNKGIEEHNIIKFLLNLYISKTGTFYRLVTEELKRVILESKEFESFLESEKQNVDYEYNKSKNRIEIKYKK